MGSPQTTRRGLLGAAVALPVATLPLAALAAAPAPATLWTEWMQEVTFWSTYEHQVEAIAKSAASKGLSPNDIVCVGTVGRGYEKKRLQFYFGDYWEGGDYVMISADGGYSFTNLLREPVPRLA